MKKLFSLINSVLLLISLCSCSNEPTLEEKERNGIEFYSYAGYEYPKALGKPEHSSKEINNIKKEESRSLIHTYIDYVMYSKENISEDELIDNALLYLFGTYDEVGKITIFLKDEEVLLLYIKTDDKFYILDIANKYNLGDDFILFSSLNELRDKIDDYYSGQIISQTAINNYDDIRNIKYSNYKNAKIYNYCGVDVFYDLGMPKLTLNEIIYLMKYDRDNVAKKITTLADALAYVVLSKVKYQDNTGWSFKDFDIADVGNVFYHGDQWAYSTSGRELLDLRLGQCSSMCTLFNYLLFGDYKEVGYVSTTGHAMLYIVDDNDRYYLLNPANYITSIHGEIDANLNECSCTNMDLVSKDPNKLFADLMEDFESNFVYTFSYDGVWCYRAIHNDFANPDEIRIFPKDAKVVCYAGNPNFKQEVPPHSTSQETILGLKFD